MKKIIITIGVLFAFAGICRAETLNQEDFKINLLLNPGFERGTGAPSEWAVNNWGGVTAQNIWDNSTSHSGLRCIKITVASQTSWGTASYTTDIFEVLASKDYFFSAWVKAENTQGPAGVSIIIKFYNTGKQEIDSHRIYDNGTFNWKQVTDIFKTPNDATYAKIWLGSSSATYASQASVWYDDVFFFEKSGQQSYPIFVSYVLDDPPSNMHLQERRDAIVELIRRLDIKFSFAMIGTYWQQIKNGVNNHNNFESWWLNTPEIVSNTDAINHSFYHYYQFACFIHRDAPQGRYDPKIPVRQNYACSFTKKAGSDDESIFSQRGDISDSLRVFRQFPPEYRMSKAFEYMVIPSGGFNSETVNVLKEKGFKAVWGALYWTDGNEEINYNTEKFTPFYSQADNKPLLLHRYSLNNTQANLAKVMRQAVRSARPIVFGTHPADHDGMNDFGPKNITYINEILRDICVNTTFYYKTAADSLDSFILFEDADSFSYDDSTKSYTVSGTNPKMCYLPGNSVSVYKADKKWLALNKAYPNQRIYGSGEFRIAIEADNDRPSLVNIEEPLDVIVLDNSYDEAAGSFTLKLSKSGRQQRISIFYNAKDSFKIYDSAHSLSEPIAEVSGGTAKSIDPAYDASYIPAEKVVSISLAASDKERFIIITDALSILLAPTDLVTQPLPANNVRLLWKDNSDNENSFYIERKQGSAGQYSQIAAVAANTINYEDKKVTSGETYSYRVRAYNSFGFSGYSNEAAAAVSASYIIVQPGYPIQKAIDNAAAGEIILLAPGCHKTDFLNVNKGVIIRSQLQDKKAVIELNGGCIDISSAGVTIKDIVIKNIGKNSRYTIYARADRYCIDSLTIENNIIRAESIFAITIENPGNNIKISNNLIYTFFNPNLIVVTPENRNPSPGSKGCHGISIYGNDIPNQDLSGVIIERNTVFNFRWSNIYLRGKYPVARQNIASSLFNWHSETGNPTRPGAKAEFEGIFENNVIGDVPDSIAGGPNKGYKRVSGTENFYMKYTDIRLLFKNWQYPNKPDFLCLTHDPNNPAKQRNAGWRK